MESFNRTTCSGRVILVLTTPPVLDWTGTGANVSGPINGLWVGGFRLEHVN